MPVKKQPNKKIVNKNKPNTDGVVRSKISSGSSKSLFNHDKNLIHCGSISTEVLTDVSKFPKDAQMAIRDAKIDAPLMMFTNPPYNDQDYEYFEQAMDSYAGIAMYKKADFVIGKDVRPVFKIRKDKDMTEKEKKAKLEKVSDKLDQLKEIDDNLKFRSKLYDAYVRAKAFGRVIIGFDGTEQDQIPAVLKLIHPRDTGRVFINQDTWDVETVQSLLPSHMFTPDEMIYLVNRPDSTKRRAMWYGISEFESIIGASRAWRRLTEFDMPEAITSGWANYVMFLVKKLGKSESDAEGEFNKIAQALRPNAFGFVSVDATDEIEAVNLDLQPKLNEMIQVADYYERTMIAPTGVPKAVMGSEEEPNRATLIGKIRFFIEGPVEADRQWLSDQIVPQWYEPNLKKIFPTEAEALLKEFEITLEFEPIFTESWDDLVDATIKLKGAVPGLPDEKILELLNLEELQDDLVEVPDNEFDPLADAPQKMAEQQVKKSLNKPLNVGTAKRKKR